MIKLNLQQFGGRGGDSGLSAYKPSDKKSVTVEKRSGGGNGQNAASEPKKERSESQGNNNIVNSRHGAVVSKLVPGEVYSYERYKDGVKSTTGNLTYAEMNAMLKDNKFKFDSDSGEWHSQVRKNVYFIIRRRR